MKKLTLGMLLLAACLTKSVSAQVKVSLDINIGSQPVWGPTGYDHAEYYYLPQYDVYYDVPHHQYIYWEGPRRVMAPNLPPRFRGADMYKTYKVVINEPNAYMHHDQHLKQYGQFRDRHDQPIIRESHEEKYWQVEGHPDHAKYRRH